MRPKDLSWTNEGCVAQKYSLIQLRAWEETRVLFVYNGLICTSQSDKIALKVGANVTRSDSVKSDS